MPGLFHLYAGLGWEPLSEWRTGLEVAQSMGAAIYLTCVVGSELNF